MKSILEDLYYGQIDPVARKPLRSPDWKERLQEITSVENLFENSMSKEQLEQYRQIEAYYLKRSDESQFGAFALGFQLGAQLLAAMFPPDSTWERFHE